MNSDGGCKKGTIQRRKSLQQEKETDALKMWVLFCCVVFFCFFFCFFLVWFCGFLFFWSCSLLFVFLVQPRPPAPAEPAHPTVRSAGGREKKNDRTLRKREERCGSPWVDLFKGGEKSEKKISQKQQLRKKICSAELNLSTTCSRKKRGPVVRVGVRRPEERAKKERLGNLLSKVFKSRARKGSAPGKSGERQKLSSKSP